MDSIFIGKPFRQDRQDLLDLIHFQFPEEIENTHCAGAHKTACGESLQIVLEYLKK